MSRSAVVCMLQESTLTCYLLIIASVFLAVRRLLTHLAPPSHQFRLPGPRGLPYVGSIPFLGSEGKLHIKFAELAKKYGGIYRISLGRSEAVIISDPVLIREAFRMEQFSARPDMLFVKHIVSGNGIILTEGEIWKEQRRFAVQQLRNFGVHRMSAAEDQLTQKIHCEIDEFLNTLEKQKERPFNLETTLSGVMGNIICTVICGKRFDYDDPTFLGCLTTMEEGFRLVKLAMGINFMPFLRFIPMMNTVYLKIKNNNIATKAFFRSLISEHVNTIQPGKTRDFVDAYLHKIQRQTSTVHDVVSSFTDAQMMQCVIDLFSAGMETTKASLQWAFLYMAKHPEIQRKVQQELDELIDAKRRPSMDDLRNLIYTEAVFCEVMRASSVLPLGNPHAATEDTFFHGHIVPKGATIIPNIWAVHNDENLWDNPKIFNPERFLVEGQLQKPPHYIPFSTGRRVCLGDQLAKTEIMLVFTAVLQRFDLAFPLGKPTPDCEGSLGMTLNPKPFQLVFSPREGGLPRPA